ncbi:MAG TPA: hypothetical protein DC049_00160 [Spirochaetia bacterium]|nr:hypothetical protein [Spirochaetia bacterium]
MPANMAYTLFFFSREFIFMNFNKYIVEIVLLTQEIAPITDQLFTYYNLYRFNCQVKFKKFTLVHRVNAHF